MGMKAVRLCAKRKGQIQEIFRMLIQQTILCLGKAKATEARNSEKKKKAHFTQVKHKFNFGYFESKESKGIRWTALGLGGEKKWTALGLRNKKPRQVLETSESPVQSL